MTMLRQKTAFGPGTYRGRKFDRAKLQAFVDGTNKAIAAGIPVPLLRRHAKINASDSETMQFSKEEVDEVFEHDERGSLGPGLKRLHVLDAEIIRPC